MNITNDALSILLILVPGYIACVTYRFIVGFRKHEAIIWIFEILTFSLAVYYMSHLVGLNTSAPHIFNEQLYWKDYAIQGIQTVCVSVVAVICGISAAYIHEKDYFMRIMRHLKITTNTSDATAWQAAFKHQKRFITVHFKDGRRLCGHPLYYTGSNDEKYVYIQDHAWISDDDRYIEGRAHGILIKEDNIHCIEFQFEKDENEEAS